MSERPLDSGRKDALGRTVRVAADAGESRADAPAPPGSDPAGHDFVFSHDDGDGRRCARCGELESAHTGPRRDFAMFSDAGNEAVREVLDGVAADLTQLSGLSDWEALHLVQSRVFISEVDDTASREAIWAELEPMWETAQNPPPAENVPVSARDRLAVGLDLIEQTKITVSKAAVVECWDAAAARFPQMRSLTLQPGDDGFLGSVEMLDETGEPIDHGFGYADGSEEWGVVVDGFNVVCGPDGSVQADPGEWFHTISQEMVDEYRDDLEEGV